MPEVPDGNYRRELPAVASRFKEIAVTCGHISNRIPWGSGTGRPPPTALLVYRRMKLLLAFAGTR